MCDYSLHAIQNRLAVDGEELTIHRFPTHSIGMASAADLRARCSSRGSGAKQSWWAKFMNWMNASMQTESVPAVCIPPGARLRLMGIPDAVQSKLGVGAVEDVVFTELTAQPNHYRDAVRFASGREVLLQVLPEGIRVQVLSLGASEPEPVREEPLRSARMFL